MREFGKFESEIAREFWDYVNDKENETECEMYEDTLYMWFEPDQLQKFSDRWLEPSEPFPVKVVGGTISIDCSDFMGGYGFTMQELWEFEKEPSE